MPYAACMRTLCGPDVTVVEATCVRLRSAFGCLESVWLWPRDVHETYGAEAREEPALAEG